MSYQALARKWRPRTFSQLVGQEHINKALINALNQQRLHHAYLFTGTRGVGKTSVARILAKALNCEQGISSDPCLACDACLAIEQGRFIDLIEIDGASKTRVEDTRELLDNVQYVPTSGRFKIYLIDEVHMLSQHSFNALLKTLEEPPAHVKFILATTDPQKLPVTVLSRCLQFNLRHLSDKLISQQLMLVLNEESMDFEQSAVDILAHAADGSMRDALSLLDQAITGCDGKLIAQDIKLLLGYTQQDYALQLLSFLANQDAASIIQITQQIAQEGGHFKYVLDELLSHLHEMSLYQQIGDNGSLLNTSLEIQKLSQQLSGEDIQLFYQIALNGKEEIHFAPTFAVGFNMTLLRMLTFRPASRVTAPELAASVTSVSKSEIQNSIAMSPFHEAITPITITPKVSPIEPPKPLETEWTKIIPHLKLTGLSLNAVEHAEFVEKADHRITLKVIKGHLSLFIPTIVTRIEAALSDYYQSETKIDLKNEVSVNATPAQQKERLTQKKLLDAESSLQKDPVFQQIQQEFSAELVKNSIVPLKDEL